MRHEFRGFPRDAKLYLCSQVLLAGYYTWPFWFGFASERISASQFGIYLAVGYIVGLLAEVPTGAFADNFGRKRSAILGSIAGVVSPFIIFLGGDFTAYVISAFVTGVGAAFISGSLESLLYELPSVSKQIYRRVLVHDTFFWQTGLIISTGLGGVLYVVDPVLPFIAQSLSFLAAALIIMNMQPDVVRRAVEPRLISNRERMAQYVHTNKEGFMHLFAIRKLWPLLIFGSTLGAALWMSIENLNEAAMIHYAISPDKRGLLLAFVKVLALVILNLFVIKHIKNDRQKVTYLCLLSMLVFGLYSFGIKTLFLIGFLGFNLISSVNNNFIRPIIHDHISDKWRATAISAYSFLGNLVQAAVSLLVGVLLQNKGIVFVQRLLFLMLALIALPAALRILPRLRQNN